MKTCKDAIEELKGLDNLIALEGTDAKEELKEKRITFNFLQPLERMMISSSKLEKNSALASKYGKDYNRLINKRLDKLTKEMLKN